MNISNNLTDNMNYIKSEFSLPKNFDLVVREFQVKAGGRYLDAFVIYYDGLSNSERINSNIIFPMQSGIGQAAGISLTDNIYRQIIAITPLSLADSMEKVIDSVSFGEAAVFVDGCDRAFMADSKGWSRREVGTPTMEASLSGPQEAFAETIMMNIGLVRKIVKDKKLIAEKIEIGRRGKTPCAIMYIEDIANPNLVNEVRRRLENIQPDYVFSISEVEQLIETSTFMPNPQILKTERPDKAASALTDGKCIVILQGSPFIMLLPSVGLDFIEASEDNYIRFPSANFMRLVRLMGIAIALFLPGAFIAMALYHHEIIPTDLLLAIEKTRELAPFPIFAELILVELAFELIKEASIRIPSPIGSTIGIIGGIILGQAAVEANIVSPIVIIIVAISGIGSFAIPSLALARAVSVSRFAFTIFAFFGGFLGIVCMTLISLFLVANQNSFGTPYLSAIAPFGGNLLIPPMWKKEKRPDAFNPQISEKQPRISRKWGAKLYDTNKG